MLIAKIFVQLKPSVLDPQGKAISNSLHQLGYDKVIDTRVSKYIELVLDLGDEALAREQVEKICSDLLANPNTEHYHYSLEPKE
jgi:phosphoribosylformylglycinamidine synthase